VSAVPLHYLVDGRDMASMPVDQWVGDAAVVDLTHLGADGEVTAADLDRRAGHVRRGDIVLLRTDWPRRMGVDKEQFWKEGPWTGPSACEWLVVRGAKAVGYDYPPDHCIRDTIAEPRRRPGRSEYAIFFPAGITVIEYLTNLDQIGAARCRFMALPLKLEGADGSPVRAIALVE
jgi:kynurenine formamidase